MPAIIYLIYSLHSIIPRLFIYLFLLFVSFFSFCWSYMTWRYCSLDVCFRSVHHLSLDYVMASLRNSSQIYLYVYHMYTSSIESISFSFLSFCLFSLLPFPSLPPTHPIPSFIIGDDRTKDLIDSSLTRTQRSNAVATNVSCHLPTRRLVFWSIQFLAFWLFSLSVSLI